MAKFRFKKILIVKPSSLGDIVHSLPFLNSIKTCFPGAEVHWVVARDFQALLDGHPMIDKLLVINKNQWKKLSSAGKTIREIRLFLGTIKKEAYDLAVDLQGLLRSGIITRATGSKMRVGFQEAREGGHHFYTHKVKGGRNNHAIERYLKIAAFLGCESNSIRYPLPPLPDRESLGFTLPEKYVVISPSAGKEANRWPVERFGELAARLPLKAIVVSGPSDAHLAEKVSELSKGNAFSVGGSTSLRDLCSVIRDAKTMICNDTGPMHIAAAFNVPVVAMFGPANPKRTGPYGGIHQVIRKELDCSPCYRKKKCADWKCMESIPVKEVLNAVLAKI
jgi:lipopolysaccharide heptosyltransferase I